MFFKQYMVQLVWLVIQQSFFWGGGGLKIYSRDRWLCHLLSKTSTFHNIIDSYDLPVSNIFLMTATQTIEKNVI